MENMKEEKEKKKVRDLIKPTEREKRMRNGGKEDIDKRTKE